MNDYDAIANDAAETFDAIVSEIKSSYKKRIIVSRIVRVGVCAAVATAAAVAIKNHK